MTHDIRLREVRESDLPIFFEQQLDEEANYMAAYVADDPTDRAAFDAHWKKVLSDNSNINRTILFDGQVAGNIAKFIQFDEPEVSYWIGKEYWGKGIATRALALLLEQVTERPLFARVVKDNIASLRVLEKCGFTIVGEDSGFANARVKETEEYILRLDADRAGSQVQ